MALGIALVFLNKFLLASGHFPHAVALTAMHMALTSGVLFVLYLLQPSMFPGMATACRALPGLSRRVLPIGLLQCVSLIAANAAYSYCSVALLQFMKQASVLLVFAFSSLFGMQQASLVRVALLFWIMSAAVLSVAGDAAFSATGAAIQFIAELSSGLGVVLCEMMLTTGTHRLDPLSLTLLLAPTTCIILAVCVMETSVYEVAAGILVWWRPLLLNASTACALNITGAYLIREISAVGLVLADLVQGLFVAVIAAAVLGERILPRQWAFFGLTLLGVGTWSCLSVRPGGMSTFWMPSADARLKKRLRLTEQTPLVGA